MTKNNYTFSLAALFALVILLSGSFKSFSQKLPCPPNVDWEFGNTTGWLGYYGGASDTGGVQSWPTSGPQTVITTPYTGFVTGRHVVTDASMPNDPYGNFPVVAPGGGVHSFKLGDDNTGNGAESVEFYINVPVGLNTYSLNYAYAVVLDDASHATWEQPRFTLEVTDSATGISLKDGCYNQNYIAAPGLPGFFDSPLGSEFAPIRVKPWTNAVLNISGAAGTTVKVKVTTGDCSLGGHFGYGYFDVIDCGEFKTVVISCDLDRDGIVLTGPAGYMTYNWWNQDYSAIVDTGESIRYFPANTVTQSYHLEMIPFPSVSSCRDTLHTIPLANISLEPEKDTVCMPLGNTIQLDAKAQGGAGFLTYEWTEFPGTNTLSCYGCTTPVASPTTSSLYTIKVTDTNGCYRTRVLSIGVNENTFDAIDDFVLCHSGYTQLNVAITGPLPLTPVSCGISSSAACAAPAVLEVRSLYSATQPPLKNTYDTSTLNNPFASQRSSSHIQFLLKKEDMYASGFRYGAISSLEFDVVKASPVPFSNFKISLGCTDRSSLSGGFVSGTNVVYTAPGDVNSIAGWNTFTFDQAYNWDTGQNLVVDICYTISNTDTPATVVTLKTGTVDAIAEFTTTNGLNVCQGGTAEKIENYTNRPKLRLGYCKSPDIPYPFTWTPGLFLSDSTIKDPLAYVPQTIEYFVQSIGGSYCPFIDSVTITVPIHDYEIFPKDTSVCLGQPFGLIATGTFSSVQWYEYDPITNTFTIPTTLSCAGCPDPNKIPNPIANPTDTISYAVEYTDKDGCNDTLYMNAIVRPLPPVRILNNDTTIKYGQDIMLLASGAYLYTWFPISTLSNPNIVNPVASPKEPTTYYVYGIGENGCRKIDSVRVNIDYRANLFVPTAFTPNGDGKNDVFRVTNMTFQRLLEFRVFNRWGQEIFSTNDIKKGWDGSWKGQPQDMGAYQYHIRVAYPDGYVETYKGNITLVR